MNVLVLNCGSSSVKYQLIDTSIELIESNGDRTKARGSVERLGSGIALHSWEFPGAPKSSETSEILEHRQAIAEILKLLCDPERGVVKSPADIAAVGHRIVHGGERFSQSTLITPDVERGIQECSELAPLHNPHNLRGYHAAKQRSEEHTSELQSR